jgi:hypothetical protein
MSSPLCKNLLNLLKVNTELKRDLNRSYWSEDAISLFYKTCQSIENQEEIQTLEDMTKRLTRENKRLLRDKIK